MHPFYASHHQKIIAIDDTVAFVGGVDLTTGRWDTRAHLSRDRRRRGLNGRRHGPVRDVQMIVDSDAAVALADLVRERWRLATGEALRPCGRDGDVWPEGLEPQFNDHTVGISRTMPDWRKGTAVSEILHLAEDMLRSARDLVYVEAQYFFAASASAGSSRNSWSGPADPKWSSSPAGPCREWLRPGPWEATATG
ncbi:hypothetical protein QW131_00745 [Roseibium salinum]|nr:hypothetical protein [Roseibium salinum]